jgi:hypothetical protein
MEVFLLLERAVIRSVFLSDAIFLFFFCWTFVLVIANCFYFSALHLPKNKGNLFLSNVISAAIFLFFGV